MRPDRFEKGGALLAEQRAVEGAFVGREVVVRPPRARAALPITVVGVLGVRVSIRRVVIVGATGRRAVVGAPACAAVGLPG
ncbi:MAG: hypothetical protein EBR86_07270 [Planctomycetia bacterium]|nr:hypothetical protein [Planctomycetia bacterium]